MTVLCFYVCGCCWWGQRGCQGGFNTDWRFGYAWGSRVVRVGIRDVRAVMSGDVRIKIPD